MESNPKVDRNLWFAMGSQSLPAVERGPGNHRYGRPQSERHFCGNSRTLGKAVLSDLVVEFCASGGDRMADAGPSEWKNSTSPRGRAVFRSGPERPGRK